MRNDDKDGRIDNSLVPLSSSLVMDLQKEIGYLNTRFCKPGERGYFEQTFTNKFYSERNNKLLQRQAQQDELLRERAALQRTRYTKKPVVLTGLLSMVPQTRNQVSKTFIKMR